MEFAPLRISIVPWSYEIESRHSFENKKCRAPCPVPFEMAGNELCNSGFSNGSVPKIEVGVPCQWDTN
eukprot:955608-Pyramimonas_sp.AAC.1